MRKQNKIAIVIACALVAALGWSGQVQAMVVGSSMTPTKGSELGGQRVVISGDGFLKEVIFTEIQVGSRGLCALDT